MKYTLIALLSIFMLGLSLPALASPPESDDDDRSTALSLTAELGFNAPVYHRIQFGQDGTYLDYVGEGGQDVLFPFARLSVDALLGERHRLTFLWQPLDVQTRVRLNRDIVVDDALFEEGTPVALRYSFPFYRFSYAYDVVDKERTDIGLGGSLQIRNATIAVESAQGDLRRDRRDVGLVPALKFRGHHQRESGWWYGAEIDGFYAPIRYLNISDTDVIGAILDASIRLGTEATDQVDLFLNLRYLGGGADGTSPSQAEEGPGDGYTRNWLNLVILSIGFQLDLNQK